MDLYAYTQIDSLEEIMKASGINVPRLRGLRLMKDEELITKDCIADMLETVEVDVVKDLCRSNPFWNPNSYSHSYSLWTDHLVSYYISDDKVRWDRIHGWKRRIAKFEIKKTKRRIKEQYDMFNKYVGKTDVLYIHARIGGNNWSYFNGDTVVAKQPWFLDKVYDWVDGTYCDIYVKISPDCLKMLAEAEKENE